VSEVFIDVWSQAGRFEGRSQVSTWILSIARFKALSALHRRRESELDETAMEMIADTAEPEQAVLNADLSGQLRSCLAQMSREHRQVIDLVYYREKSVEESRQDHAHAQEYGEDPRALRPQAIGESSDGAGDLRSPFGTASGLSVSAPGRH
jgi:Sigma-70 region 2